MKSHSRSCAYTIRKREDLDADFASGGSGEFLERTSWRAAAELLQQAKDGGRVLPIIFADASAGGGIIYWAKIEDILVKDGSTTVRFSQLRRFNRPQAKQKVVVLSTQEPLLDTDIRPYRICRTPKFIEAAYSISAGNHDPGDDSAKPLPSGIRKEHLLKAIEDFDAGRKHAFADSTGYDLVFQKRRYPPKAIVGLAAEAVSGRSYHPRDFSGGRGSKCFRLLQAHEFEIVSKGDVDPFPEEILGDGSHFEGAIKRVWVNKFERDPKARAKCLEHFGFQCSVCGLLLLDQYGELAKGFIHVHHTVPLNSIGQEYKVDPRKDLRPVCPNCHAMLHRKNPPFAIEELKAMLLAH